MLHCAVLHFLDSGHIVYPKLIYMLNKNSSCQQLTYIPRFACSRVVGAKALRWFGALKSVSYKWDV